ncbi:hypothetical protein [Rhizobium sp. CC-YZS058]|uniref:hypothetical protein n=1 Tax=Rhizobium sp. CC-YZS058 TaxID=3042153 RepID=UPI002B05FD96|nr:hypothetical protein [Rhizobium sp. CC-YZS058]MEA3535688.1 hypothetical protein [Rhizobium sp. CC-YZS058]
MDGIGLTSLDPLDAAAAFCFCAGVLLVVRQWLKTRLHGLRIAEQALVDHLMRMEQVISDPALPANTQRFLAAFADAVADPAAADAFDRGLESESRLKADELQILEELDRLALTRPDLAEGVRQAVSKGILFLLLRRSPSKRQISEFLFRFAGDPNREVGLASRYLLKRPVASFGLLRA